MIWTRHLARMEITPHIMHSALYPNSKKNFVGVIYQHDLKHDITLISTTDKFWKHLEFLFVNKHAHTRRIYTPTAKYCFCFVWNTCLWAGKKNLKLAHAYLKRSSRKSTWISVINFRHKRYSFHDVYKSSDTDTVRIKGNEVMACILKSKMRIMPNVGEETASTVSFEVRGEGKIALR